MKNIWIIEDDHGSQFVYSQILGERFSLSVFGDLKAFRQAVATSPAPDLLIADVRLPDETFLTFLSSLTSPLPFPFLVASSIDDVDSLRVCFGKGAIDYIVKPFPSSELVAKVEKALRNPFENIRGDVFVDSTTLTVQHAGVRTGVLTPKEFQIVAVIQQTPERTMSRAKLISKLWDGTTVTDKAFDVHLSNLRKKLRPIGLEIPYTNNHYRLIEQPGKPND